MNRWHRAPEVLKAAEVWKERCLLADGSVLSAHHLWTSKNLDQLDRHFVQNLDLGKEGFYNKLESQLKPTTVDAKQLAADALVHVSICVIFRDEWRIKAERDQESLGMVGGGNSS